MLPVRPIFVFRMMEEITTSLFCRVKVNPFRDLS
jgi:hypothetical protein